MLTRKSRLTSALVLALGTLGLANGAAHADIGQAPGGDSSRTLGGYIAGGAYSVGIQDGNARGTGPSGPIDVKLTRTAAGYDVAGIWNGGRVHFVLDPQGVHGTAVKPPTPGRLTETCHFNVSPRSNGGGYAGVARCQGDSGIRHLAFDPSSPGISAEQRVVLLLAHLMAPAGRRGL